MTPFADFMCGRMSDMMKDAAVQVLCDQQE